MAKVQPAEAAEIARAGLAERLRFTSGVTEACHLLLEAVLGTEDIEEAAVVVRAEDTFRGAGYGMSDDRLQAFLRSRGGEIQQLREAIDGGSPTRLYPEGDDLTSLGIGVATVIPFPGPRGIPAGAVIIDGVVADALIRRVRDMADEAGPQLARIAEVDVLRSQVQRLEQDLSLLDAMVN